MARLKRYELYEGDGEIIPDRYTPPEEREDRQQEKKPEPARTQVPRNRYFTRNEDDGLGPSTPLYDDFERFNPAPEPEKRVKKKPPKHYNGGWVAVIAVCLILLAAMGILMLPQLTGIRYRFLPNVGFMNGSVITLDGKREETHRLCREEIFTDRIYQGIYIDDVHVGGMTREEAVRQVQAVNTEEDAKFDLLVTVGNENWHVNSERVPFWKRWTRHGPQGAAIPRQTGAAEKPPLRSGFRQWRICAPFPRPTRRNRITTTRRCGP